MKNPRSKKINSLTGQIYTYTAVFEPDTESGGYTVIVPALPGCISEGDTFEKAVKNIKEAIELYVEVVKGERQFIKKESGILVGSVSIRV
ncbi:MAG: type II toxin-antitoxin system HicB family antitoxin [Patescibacteria group bacterium]